MSSCGCVGARAKRSLVMLARATARRLEEGREPSLPEKGKVGLSTLWELADKGLVAPMYVGAERRWFVTDRGAKKIVEWQRLGLV